ncbi:MAG: hypothetical protein A3G33_00360 [Omnitrophica bacterium RIFCSPLOWO2_12_FULL_44_17]|uniref:Uncharacterized protein n=1 Tax=Candidatus Danuiimicrobium aquiferis TaxID=1801832 RepID=A0A1G1KVF8_9BACT|nr:MAG: hypothetical protein A3G33_00360 [Omnitrophica bacterium RIFCSPLOWO2_12_FULL_44_17]
MKYVDVFDLITTELRIANIPFVLIGGFAVNYYQATRMTADVDILMTEKDFIEILPVLEQEGYKVDVKNDLFVRLSSRVSNWMDLDVIFVDRDTLAGMIKDGKEIEMQGKRIFVPSLEHLIALKLHSLKHNQQGREYKDMGDILELIKRNRLDIHSDRFHELCLKYGTEELYRKIAEYIKT